MEGEGKAFSPLLPPPPPVYVYDKDGKEYFVLSINLMLHKIKVATSDPVLNKPLPFSRRGKWFENIIHNIIPPRGMGLIQRLKR